MTGNGLDYKYNCNISNLDGPFKDFTKNVLTLIGSDKSFIRHASETFKTRPSELLILLDRMNLFWFYRRTDDSTAITLQNDQSNSPAAFKVLPTI